MICVGDALHYDVGIERALLTVLLCGVSLLHMDADASDVERASNALEGSADKEISYRQRTLLRAPLGPWVAASRPCEQRCSTSHAPMHRARAAEVSSVNVDCVRHRAK